MVYATSEAVAEAVTKIEAEGGRVSVRSVRASLGGGSPNQINSLLKPYRTAKANRLKTISIDARLSKAITEFVEKAVAEATAELESQLREAEQDNELLANEVRELGEGNATLKSKLDAADKINNQHEGSIRQLKNQVTTLEESHANTAELQRDLAVALAMREATDAKASKLEEEIATIRAAAHAAELELAASRANNKFATVPAAPD